VELGCKRLGLLIVRNHAHPLSELSRAPAVYRRCEFVNFHRRIRCHRCNSDKPAEPARPRTVNQEGRRPAHPSGPAEQAGHAPGTRDIRQGVHATERGRPSGDPGQVALRLLCIQPEESGAIIGMRGTRISAIRQKSGAQISLPEDMYVVAAPAKRDGCPTDCFHASHRFLCPDRRCLRRLVIIDGTRAAVLRAVESCMEHILTQLGTRPPPVAAGPPQNTRRTARNIAPGMQQDA
jgi:hypothetical protein